MSVEKVKDVYQQMFPLGIPSMNPGTATSR